MSKAQQPGAPAPTCPVEMSDSLPCGRRIYHAPGSAGPSVHCIMHCRETTKDPLQFRQEIDAILGGTSTNHRPKDGFDFTGFVFFEANFSGEYFTQNHDFSFATFTQKANFFRAVFSKNANVNANFSEAHFIQDADFSFVDFGIKAMGLATDTQHMGYVLREGEREPPAGIQKALATSNRLQDLLMERMRPGRSGNEILAETLAAMKAAGIKGSTHASHT